MKTRISIPERVIVEDSCLVQLEKIETKDCNGHSNGWVRPIQNALIPGIEPIMMVYMTHCEPGAIKGPHVHFRDKLDRFVLLEGSCIVATRNEQTLQHRVYVFKHPVVDLLMIPSYNSHIVYSKDGATLLSLPNEGYYPGHYNQEDLEWEGYDWESLKRRL